MSTKETLKYGTTTSLNETNLKKLTKKTKNRYKVSTILSISIRY